MQNEGRPRRTTKGAATKKTIFEAARTLFKTRDYDAVSVEKIVQEAGVSKGTFYVHFASKDALIASIVEEYVGTVDLGYQKHLDSLPRDMPFPDVLLSLIEKIADTLTDEIGVESMRHVYQLQLSGSVNVETVKTYNRELYHIFGHILAQGIEYGAFCAGLPLDELTRHFVTAIRGMSYEWCIRYPHFDLKKQALAHCSILLTGIQKR